MPPEVVTSWDEPPVAPVAPVAPAKAGAAPVVSDWDEASSAPSFLRRTADWVKANAGGAISDVGDVLKRAAGFTPQVTAARGAEQALGGTEAMIAGGAGFGGTIASGVTGGAASLSALMKGQPAGEAFYRDFERAQALQKEYVEPLLKPQMKSAQAVEHAFELMGEGINWLSERATDVGGPYAGALVSGVMQTVGLPAAFHALTSAVPLAGSTAAALMARAKRGAEAPEKPVSVADQLRAVRPQEAPEPPTGAPAPGEGEGPAGRTVPSPDTATTQAGMVPAGLSRDQYDQWRIDELNRLNPQLGGALRMSILSADEQAARGDEPGGHSQGGHSGSEVTRSSDAPAGTITHEIRHMIDMLLGGFQPSKWLAENKPLRDKIEAYLKGERENGGIGPGARFTDPKETAQAMLDAYYRNKEGLRGVAPEMVQYLESMGADKYAYLNKTSAEHDGARAAQFKPTGDWQPVPPDAVLPSGLEIRMNMQTGMNEARLRPAAAPEPAPGAPAPAPGLKGQIEATKILAPEELAALKAKSDELGHRLNSAKPASREYNDLYQEFGVAYRKWQDETQKARKAAQAPEPAPSPEVGKPEVMVDWGKVTGGEAVDLAEYFRKPVEDVRDGALRLLARGDAPMSRAAQAELDRRAAGRPAEPRAGVSPAPGQPPDQPAIPAPAGAPLFKPQPGEDGLTPRHGTLGANYTFLDPKELSLSDEVPNFKKGANARGVVEPLTGKWDPVGVGPIQVWERLDGKQQIISGRHRWNKALDDGAEDILGQVHREADGFTAKMARTLDAELNIKDGNGSVGDYANYFKESGLTREEADARGLVGRAKGKAGFQIANDASEEVFAAHRAGELSDEAAAEIAKAAPGDSAVQAIGLKMVAIDEKPIKLAVNIMRAAQSTRRDREFAKGQYQPDMLGFDDSGLKKLEEMAEAAGKAQREVAEQLAAVSGATKRPDLARKLGVDVKDPKAVQAKIEELKVEKDRLQKWHTDPALVRRFGGDMREQAPVEAPPEEEPPFVDTQTQGMFQARARYDPNQQGLGFGEQPKEPKAKQEARTEGADERDVEINKKLLAELNANPAEYFASRIFHDLDPSRYGGRRTAEAIAANHGDPRKGPGSTMTAADFQPTLDRLVDEGKIVFFKGAYQLPGTGAVKVRPTIPESPKQKGWVTPEFAKRAEDIAQKFVAAGDEYTATKVRNIPKGIIPGAADQLDAATRTLEQFEADLANTKPKRQQIHEIADGFEKIGFKKDAAAMRAIAADPKALEGFTGDKIARARQLQQHFSTPLPDTIFHRQANGKLVPFPDRVAAAMKIQYLQQGTMRGKFSVINTGTGVAIRVEKWPGGITAVEGDGGGLFGKAPARARTADEILADNRAERAAATAAPDTATAAPEGPALHNRLYDEIGKLDVVISDPPRTKGGPAGPVLPDFEQQLGRSNIAKAIIYGLRDGKTNAKIIERINGFTDNTIAPEALKRIEALIDSTRSAQKPTVAPVTPVTPRRQAREPWMDRFTVIESPAGSGKWRAAGARNLNPVSPSFDTVAAAEAWARNFVDEGTQHQRPGLELAGETEADARSRDQAERGRRAKEDEDLAARDRAAREERERKEIAERSKTAGFDLTQTEAVDAKRQAEIDRKAAEDKLAGQNSLFEPGGKYDAAGAREHIQNGFAPARADIAEQYKQRATRLFEDMRAKLGDDLKGIHNSYEFVRPFNAIVRANLKREGHDYRNKGGAYSIDEAKLDANAQKYAEAALKESTEKVLAKLGDVTDVRAEYATGNGNYRVTAKRGAQDVVIEQQMIINVSTKGTVFNQWPARIYVDGKLTSEKAYTAGKPPTAEEPGADYRARRIRGDVPQSVSSAKTSRKQVPASIKAIPWEDGQVNIDIGAGKFDDTTAWLADRGVTNLDYDPFNRSEPANVAALEAVIERGGADSATVANVLNVIPDAAARDNVVRRAAKALKPGGVAYFQVYEGNQTGRGAATRDGWQENRRADSYIPEIEKRFHRVQRTGQVIHAMDPIEVDTRWRENGDILFQERAPYSIARRAEEIAKLEGMVDRAYERGDPKAEDLDARLMRMREDLEDTGDAEPDAYSEGQHAAFSGATVEGQLIGRYRDLQKLDAGGKVGAFGNDREAIIGNMRAVIEDNGGRPGTDAEVIAAAKDAADAYDARAARRGQVRPDLEVEQQRAPYDAGRDRQEPAPWYYSELARSVEASPMKQGSGKAWADYIKSRVGKGVKPEEIEATGINDWLDTQDGKITKEQIAAFMEQGGVQISEKMLGAPVEGYVTSADHAEAVRKAIEQEHIAGRLWRDLEMAIPPQSGVNRANLPWWGREMAGMSGFEEAKLAEEKARGIGLTDEQIDRLREYGEAANASRRQQQIAAELRDAVSEVETKFGQYQEPGAVPGSYRELVLTLPEKPTPESIALDALRTKIRKRLGRDEFQYEDMTEAEYTQWESLRPAVADAAPAARFESTHFPGSNYLAHTRVNDRILPDGRKVLFVEEIQSDRAQKGRTVGFDNQLPPIYEYRDQDGKVGIYNIDPENQNAHGWAVTPTFDSKATALREFQRMGRGMGNVPSAPFVTKTDSWTALVLKRLLRYAAEGEYDAIAWTRGEQQVERYTSALRKAVDTIEWKKTPEGVQIVGYKGRSDAAREVPQMIRGEADQALRHNDQLGFDTLAEARQAVASHPDWLDRWDVPAQADRRAIQRYIDATVAQENSRTKVVDTRVAENAVSDAIGKSMADKIRNDPAQTGTIEGENININDTGMAGFYDRIVPKVAAEVAKKVGGGKVVEVQIPGKTTLLADKNPTTGRWFVRDPITDERWMDPETTQDSPEFKTAREALDFIEKMGPNSAGIRQQAIEITPAMREKIMAGQALFEPKSEYGAAGESKRAQLEAKAADLRRQFDEANVKGLPTRGRLYGSLQKVLRQIDELEIGGQPGEVREKKGRREAIRGQAPEGQLDLFTAKPVQGSPVKAFEKIVVEAQKVGEYKVRATKVDNPSAAASVFQDLNKSPMEKFQVLGLDKDNTPIAFFDMFAGTLTQTSVFPREVWTAIYQTPGVKSVWLAHQHPSGLAQPSHADMILTRSLQRALTSDVGVDLKGHIIIAGDEAIDIGPDGHGHDIVSIAAGERTHTIPIMERVITKRENPTDNLSSPAAARDFFRKFDPKETGLLVLDAQNRVTGWWPMSIAEMSKLKTGDINTGMAALIRRVGRGNAAATMAYSPDPIPAGAGGSGPFSRAVQNVGTALALADVKMLDAFTPDGGVIASTQGRLASHAEMGWSVNGLTDFNIGIPLGPELARLAGAAGDIGRAAWGRAKETKLGAAAAEWGAAVLKDLQIKVVPMAAGTDAARAINKDFANADRLSQYNWQRRDDILKKSFTEEQQKKMWDAGDEEDTLRREKVPEAERAGRGLDSLTKDERESLEVLTEDGQKLLERAKDVGLFRGEGVDFWVPRVIAMIGEDGSFSPPRAPKGAGGIPSGPGRSPYTSPVGGNITTQAGSLKRRKYATAEETEAAAKAKFGEGAQVVRNIRTMPMAMARIERAIAGRELINAIKEFGKTTGQETVIDAARPGFFTLDHPAFKIYRYRSDIKFTEAWDARMWDQMQAFAGDIGVDAKRLATMRGRTWGKSYQGANLVETRFGGPETVLTHELGHQLDHKYGLVEKFFGGDRPKSDFILQRQIAKAEREGNMAAAEKYQKQMDINREMRDLADLRFEGQETTDYYKKYVRIGTEKMANMVHAYVHAPEKFRSVAPTAYNEFKQFLNQHPELARLDRIKPSLVLEAGGFKKRPPGEDFDVFPVYVSSEFEGPLKAVMSDIPGKLYQTMMDLKGKTMSVIMYSPLIHNGVEWGRAMPLMPGKILTFKAYFDGNVAKNDPQIMSQAILHGIAPISRRFFIQDITGLMEDPTLQPGRSWTAKAAGGAVGMVSKEAGQAVKRGIDAAGDFWHNTLLWDRIADLQMGIYVNVKADLIKAGHDQTTAGRMAAHLANRFAGALPNESMSANARKVANFAFFSRTFTFGNLGVMKDMVTGLPRDVQAQILRDAGEVANFAAKGEAQKIAIKAFATDIALMYAANSALQSGFDAMKRDKSYDEIEQGYIDRFDRMIKKTQESPSDLLKPFAMLESLTPTSENEPGKEQRVLYDYDETGTGIYVRMPTGKIGEEFLSWSTSPLDILKRKEGTIARPLIQTMTNDKGFGRRVYNPDAPGFKGAAKAVGNIAWNMFSQQFPVDSLNAAIDIAKGHSDKTDALKVIGPLFGVTFSKGAPGGPEVGELFTAERAHRAEVSEAMPEIKKLIKHEEMDLAIERMHEAHFTPEEIRATIRFSTMPSSRLTPRAMKKFFQIAPPEERERMERMREQNR